MEHIVYKVESIDFRTKVLIRLVNDDYKLNGIIVNYVHTSRDNTYIGITPDMTYGEVIGDDRAIEKEAEIELNIVTARNVIIIMNDFKNLRYPIEDTNETYYDDDDDFPYLYVGIKINVTASSKSSKLHEIDPILQYYKKMYPVHNIEAWSTIKDTVTYGGKVNKMTFDSVSRKFMAYFDNGMVYLFDGYPFSTTGMIQVQHFNHITPTDIHWILDNSKDDMVFISRLLIQDIILASPQFDSAMEFLNTFNDTSNNTSLKYNERMQVQYIVIDIPHLNRSLTIDLNNRNIPFSNLILELNQTYMKTFPIPWRPEYVNTSLSKIDITLFIADSEGPNAYTGNEETHMFIEFNTTIKFKCDITNELIIPFNRT